MLFDTLRINDYVRWNPLLHRNYLNLDAKQLFEDESETCHFQIIQFHNTSEDAWLTLECVNSCGTHMCLNFSREDYEEMSEQLGGELLLETDFNSIAEFSSIVESTLTNRINIETEGQKILDLLDEGKLHKRSRSA